MKEDWVVVCIGDVAEITDYVANGSFATLRENVTYHNEKNFAILVRLADFTNGFDEDKFVYVDEHAYNFLAKSKLYGGEIIMSNVGSIGKLFICPNLGQPMTLAPNSIVIRTPNNRFFYHLMQSEYFQAQIKYISSKTALPKFNKTSFKKIPISVPPLPTQERIVSELDCINSIIEKKREQLKELDALAQSIFYDMFGDPIHNEKGWEVKTIDDLCASIVRGPFGSALKKDFFVEYTPTAYKVYEQKHAIQKNVEIGTYFISAERFESLSRFEVKVGDIIMSCSGTIGEFYEIPIGAQKGVMNQALLKFTLNSDINKIFFLHVMEWVKEKFEKKGSGLQNIGSVGTIKKTFISSPPLPLQQSFASKIEAIEKQKELIKRSIAETETLLASRMQYYFG